MSQEIIVSILSLFSLAVAIVAPIIGIAAVLRARSWRQSLLVATVAHFVAGVMSFCITVSAIGIIFGGGIGAKSTREFEGFLAVALPVLVFGLLITPLIHGGIFWLFQRNNFKHIAITALFTSLVTLGVTIILGALTIFFSFR